VGDLDDGAFNSSSGSTSLEIVVIGDVAVVILGVKARVLLLARSMAAHELGVVDDVVVPVTSLI
jgi:hypothetical protein